MDCSDVIANVSNTITALAAGFAAFFAYKGLKTWQEELHGRANFDAARNFIKAAYKLRDEMKFCRAPFVSAREFPDEYYKASFSTRTTTEEGSGWAHVYNNRWKPLLGVLNEFEIFTLEAEALWGAEVKSKAEVLRKCVIHLKINIDDKVSNAFSRGADFEDKEFAKNVRQVVFDSGEDNPFTIKINAAVSDIELIMRPKLVR